MNNIKNEIWKDVPNFEGYYQASNLGKIRSIDRYVKSKRIGYTSILRKGKLLKPKVDKNGYLQIVLCKNNIMKYISVHQVIARTFLENPNKYPQVNHKDKCRINNNVINLEWCNDKQNKFHNWKLKSKDYPKNINYDEIDMFLSEFRSKKLKLNDVILIRDLYSNGKYTQLQLSKIFNVSEGCVWSIVNFKKWKPY